MLKPYHDLLCTMLIRKSKMMQMAEESRKIVHLAYLHYFAAVIMAPLICEKESSPRGSKIFPEASLQHQDLTTFAGSSSNRTWEWTALCRDTDNSQMIRLEIDVGRWTCQICMHSHLVCILLKMIYERYHKHKILSNCLKPAETCQQYPQYPPMNPDHNDLPISHEWTFLPIIINE